MKDWLEWPLRRQFEVAARYGLLAMVLVFLFWGFWSIFGPVPEITNIELVEGATYTLPVAYSRWWDVPTAYLFVFLYWWVSLGLAKIIAYSWDSEDYTVGTCGLLLTLDLVISLAAGLSSGLLFGLAIGLLVGPIAILTVSLLIALSIGLFVGLENGVRLLKSLTNKGFWRRLRGWLMAVETQ